MVIHRLRRQRKWCSDAAELEKKSKHHRRFIHQGGRGTLQPNINTGKTTSYSIPGHFWSYKEHSQNSAAGFLISFPNSLLSPFINHFSSDCAADSGSLSLPPLLCLLSASWRCLYLTAYPVPPRFSIFGKTKPVSPSKHVFMPWSDAVFQSYPSIVLKQFTVSTCYWQLSCVGCIKLHAIVSISWLADKANKFSANINTVWFAICYCKYLYLELWTNHSEPLW